MVINVLFLLVWSSVGPEEVALQDPDVSSPSTTALSIRHVEFNQSIQDENNGVPLIESKASIVRFYLGASMPISGLNGELALHYATGETEVLQSLSSIDVPLNAPPPRLDERSELKNSLNFLIPPSLFRTELIHVSLRPINSTVAISIDCNNCQNIPLPKIRPSLTLKVRLVGVKIRAGKKTYEPDDVDYLLLTSWLRRAYPVGRVDVTRTAIAYDGNRHQCRDVNFVLRELKQEELREGIISDLRTHYYALMPSLKLSDGNFDEMRGCSDTPPTVNFMAVGSGPAGKLAYAWDVDESAADWYGGHEIAHTFGRLHAKQRKNCRGPLENQDPNYPNPHGYLSINDAQLVAVDTGDAAAGVPISIMPTSKWSDVMTYCEHLWISKYTYLGILARMQAEHDALSTAVAENVLLSAAEVQSGVPGASDAMTLDGGTAAYASVEASDAPNPKASPFAKEGDLLLVNAVVSTAGNKVHSVFVRRTSYAVLPTADQSSRFSLKFTFKDGSVRVFPLHEVPSDENQSIALIGAPPFEPQISIVEIVCEGRSIYKKHTDRNKPTIYGIDLPTAFGVGSEGAPVTWKGADANDADLSYTVRLSYDAGKTWEIAAIRLRTPRIEIDSKRVTDPGLVLVEVEASDGFNSTKTRFSVAP